MAQCKALHNQLASCLLAIRFCTQRFEQIYKKLSSTFVLANQTIGRSNTPGISTATWENVRQVNQNVADPTANNGPEDYPFSPGWLLCVQETKEYAG
jgi:hypothetical protein